MLPNSNIDKQLVIFRWFHSDLDIEHIGGLIVNISLKADRDIYSVRAAYVSIRAFDIVVAFNNILYIRAY